MILQHTKAGGRTVAYWIFIFNQREIATIDEAALIQAVTASNYATLSAQYGLDPDLIAPALAHLKVVTSERAACPFFLLRYLPEPAATCVLPVGWSLRDRKLPAKGGIRWL